jgi:hypothetical protein
MRLPEQRLWDVLHNNVRPGLWLQRVENILLAGMPDVLGIYKNSVPFWIELKARELTPVKTTTPLLGSEYGLNVEQRNWHRMWCDLGGRSYILIGAGQRQRRRIYLIAGSWCDAVNGMPENALRECALANGMNETISTLSS